MSIINDALKKAEKNKESFQNQHSQILSKIGNLKIEAERFVLRRWLIWTGTGIVCIVAVFLATNSFKNPTEKIITESLFVQEAIPEVEVPSSAFVPIEKGIEIDTEVSLKTSNFNLSGILYDEQKPMAIINSYVVEEGAFINGAKLLEIQPNYVRLSLQGEEFELKVK